MLTLLLTENVPDVVLEIFHPYMLAKALRTPQSQGTNAIRLELSIFDHKAQMPNLKSSTLCAIH